MLFMEMIVWSDSWKFFSCFLVRGWGVLFIFGKERIEMIFKIVSGVLLFMIGVVMIGVNGFVDVVSFEELCYVYVLCESVDVVCGVVVYVVVGVYMVVFV